MACPQRATLEDQTPYPRGTKDGNVTNHRSYLYEWEFAFGLLQCRRVIAVDMLDCRIAEWLIVAVNVLGHRGVITMDTTPHTLITFQNCAKASDYLRSGPSCGP